ncbi:hypothetical protein J4404_02840 [Candidatus Woesearchaeota archaeon]|nr:hypothetical protein [Candidatus Woesearchaeota archaeon]
MKLPAKVLLILILFSAGCNFSREVQYYDQFKSPDLNYTWDFNKTMPDWQGGHTDNQHYFRLKEYSWYQELTSLQRDAYEVSYKHEEGHIYQLQILKTDNFDEFISNFFSNINDSHPDAFRQYMIGVSEGTSDYYALDYFNGSKGKEYLRLITKNKWDLTNGWGNHYRGLCYVTYQIRNKKQSPNEFIVAMGTEEQYVDYLKYLSYGLVNCGEFIHGQFENFA